MSIMDALKKDIGGGKKDKAAKSSGEVVLASAPEAAPAAPVATAKMKGAAAVLSASPRANLLPPELGQNQRKRAVRRGLQLSIVAVLVLVALGVAGGFTLDLTAQQRLTAAQNETSSLSVELASYADVQATLTSVAQGKAARYVAGSTDIQWDEYLRQLQATLPADVTIDTVVITSADAETPYVQSAIPLEQPRIAELTFEAKTATLPSIPSWIDAMSNLPGFADATPNSLSEADGEYVASVTMHINVGAYSHRYDLVTKEAGE